MFALDLFNNDHERRLAEGAVDQLEQRRIDDLAMKMDDLVARAKTAHTPEAKAALVREFQKAKDERDSYYKIRNETMGYGSLGEETHEFKGAHGKLDVARTPGRTVVTRKEYPGSDDMRADKFSNKRLKGQGTGTAIKGGSGVASGQGSMRKFPRLDHDANDAPNYKIDESVDYEKIMDACATIYQKQYGGGDEIWDSDFMQDWAHTLEQANPTDQELDFIIAKGQMPERLADVEFDVGDDFQFNESDAQDWVDLHRRRDVSTQDQLDHEAAMRAREFERHQERIKQQQGNLAAGVDLGRWLKPYQMLEKNNFEPIETKDRFEYLMQVALKLKGTGAGFDGWTGMSTAARLFKLDPREQKLVANLIRNSPRIKDLETYMRDTVEEAGDVKAKTDDALRAHWEKVKREKQSGIPSSVPVEKIPGKADLLKGRGRSYYEGLDKIPEPRKATPDELRGRHTKQFVVKNGIIYHYQDPRGQKKNSEQVKESDQFDEIGRAHV